MFDLSFCVSWCWIWGRRKNLGGPVAQRSRDLKSPNRWLTAATRTQLGHKYFPCLQAAQPPAHGATPHRRTTKNREEFLRLSQRRAAGSDLWLRGAARARAVAGENGCRGVVQPDCSLCEPLREPPRGGRYSRAPLLLLDVLWFGVIFGCQFGNPVLTLGG
jgi:hypothetical protein